MTQVFLVQGDCLETMRQFPDACIDAIVTDPPYGLSKEPDAAEVLGHWLAGDDYQHQGAGFMGKSWDSFVPGPAVWRECLRVLKPGGHMVAFFGTRTYDIGCMAIRLAGFEIRDQLAWMYGTGFPKSLNIAKAVDATAPTGGSSPKMMADARESTGQSVAGGDERHAFHKGGDTREGVYRNKPGSGGDWEPQTPEAAQWQGWGTALKPAQEPIVLARKPLEGTVARNVLEHGCGGLNVDGCRVASSDSWYNGDPKFTRKGTRGVYFDEEPGKALNNSGRSPSHDLGRWPANVILDEEAAAELGEPSRFFYCAKASKAEREQPGCEWWQGWGTTLKPAQESIVLARKPLQDTVAKNVLEHGCGGLNVDGCRVEAKKGDEPLRWEHGRAMGYHGAEDRGPCKALTSPGRWPANVILDEEAAAMLDATQGDQNDPSRFFYCAKASKAERERGLEDMPAIAPTEVTGRKPDSAGQENPCAGMTGGRPRKNTHPTVKPISLMRWLVRLITPPGGTVLDPFTGSGSTGCAAKLEGFNFVGLELSQEYIAIAQGRINGVRSNNL